MNHGFGIYAIARRRVRTGAGGGGPPPDVTAPELVSATIPSAGTTLVLVYDETLDDTSTPDAGDYSLGGTFSAVTNVGISGSTVTLTLSQAVISTETVTVSYTAGGAPVQDAAGNDAANLSNQATTNNSAVPPALRVHTWFGSTTWTPASSGSDTVLECWSGGGGGTTATGAGGGGAYARDDSYTRTASVGVEITIGGGGAAGGGTGGTTSIGATCIAAGAVGNTGGLAASCTGDVTRSGGDGATGTGNNVGGASPGSSTEASGTTSGEPDGGLGANGNSNNAAKIPGGGGRSTGANQYSGAQGLARATYHEPATPGLPAINNATYQRTNGTSHAVTIPEGPGDTIVYFIFTDGAPTIQLAGDVGTTVLSQSNGTACTLQVMTHPAADAPTSVELSQGEWISVIALRVQDLATISGSTASDTGTNADPPSHDMVSSAPTLWFTGMVLDSETNNGDITGNAPSGYEDSIFVPTPAYVGVACMIAWRAATAQTEDPGNFTNQNGEHCTFTLGMRS